MTIERTRETYPELSRLAVLETAVQAYVHLLRLGWIYLGQLGLWLGIVFSAAFVLGLAYAVGSDERAMPEIVEAALLLVGGAVALIGLMSVCVGCHRAVLLGEKPTLLRMFRVGRRELRYPGVWVLSVIAFVGLVMGIGIIFAGYAPGAAALISIVAIGWAAFIAPLLALAFPIAALDGRHAVRTGMRQSRGHRLRLLGLLIVVHLPLILAAVPVTLLGAAAGEVVQTMLQLIQMLVLVAATSVAYERIADSAASDAAAVFD